MIERVNNDHRELPGTVSWVQQLRQKFHGMLDPFGTIIQEKNLPPGVQKVLTVDSVTLEPKQYEEYPTPTKPTHVRTGLPLEVEELEER